MKHHLRQTNKHTQKRLRNENYENLQAVLIVIRVYQRRGVTCEGVANVYGISSSSQVCVASENMLDFNSRCLLKVKALKYFFYIIAEKAKINRL